MRSALKIAPSWRAKAPRKMGHELTFAAPDDHGRAGPLYRLYTLGEAVQKRSVYPTADGSESGGGNGAVCHVLSRFGVFVSQVLARAGEITRCFTVTEVLA